MRIGIGPHGAGKTVRWRRFGTAYMDLLDSRALTVHGSVMLNGGAWYASFDGEEVGTFEHRWQAKRRVEWVAGDRVRRNAELAAKSKAFYAKATTAAYDLAVSARIGAAEVRGLAYALRRMGIDA